LSVVADEQEEGSHMNSSQKSGMMTFCQTYEMLKNKEVTPYAGPVVDGGVDASIRVAYILWHASEQGLDYAYSGIIAPFSPATTPKADYQQAQGPFKAPNFKTSSGFKAALGMDFSYDGWDLDLQYTWLHTHAHSNVSADNVGGLLQPIVPDDFVDQSTTLPDVGFFQLAKGATETNVYAGFPGVIESAWGAWRLHFNVLDLELGRNFFISSKLLMRPHYGLKGTWQKQTHFFGYHTGVGPWNKVVTSGYESTAISTKAPKDLEVTNDAPSIDMTIQQAEQDIAIYSYQNYWGLGPRAGLNLSWLMSRNFSFFTDTAVALLWGQFKDTRYDTFTITDVSTGALPINNLSPVNMRRRAHQVNAVIEMQIGMRYDYWFSNDEYRFRAEAGWENQLWFNQNQFLYGYDPYGDLSLQGFTLTFQFDF
jgi:hypothetical protein